MPRGPYQRISQTDRERLVRCFDEERDWHALATGLGINRNSARSIILKFRRTGEVGARQRGGRRDGRTRVTADVREAAVEMISVNPQLTLLQLSEDLGRQFDHQPRLSVSSIARILDGQLYSLKIARPVPFAWNTPENKTKRRTYAEWFTVHAQHRHNVYLDEFGINVWTRRTQGRAVRGERAIRHLDGQRGRNFTIVIAISPRNGLCHHMAMDGPMTPANFSAFLVELSMLLGEEEVNFIFDNAPVHNNPPVLHFDTHSIHKLPPYSPFLNPTESAGSAFKAVIKRLLSDPQQQRQFHDREAAAAEGITLHAMRLRILHQLTGQALLTVTQEKCRRWFEHTLTYIPRCVREDDIED